MNNSNRREFLRVAAGTALVGVTAWGRTRSVWAQRPGENMALGLCTYLWGRDWDLPTLIRNCETAGVLGVELRSEHAHGVEPSLDKAQRDAVKQRFADSPVKLVSLGSNERFDNPDPAKLKASMEKAKAFVVLSHDVGSSGVKVKPDSFHKDVPHEQTIEQIGRSLNELGEFAAGYGQQIRLEVHGQCAELPTIKAILDIATHKNVGICWNSNAQDLKGDGLEYNFNLVRKRFGETIHVRPLDDKSYPYQQFIDLLVKTDYRGWVLIEAHADPQDRVAALAEQQKLFKEMVAAAQAKL